MDPMGHPALRLVTDAPKSGARSHVSNDSAPLRSGDVGPPDDELVAGAIGGSRHAFEQLYRRYSGFAFGLVVRLQGSSNDVEDIVHDAFLRAHGELRALREPSAFKSWLGSIVVSHVRMRLRRGRFLRTIGIGTADAVELDSLASDAAGPEVRAELAQIYALLRVMPADDRIAWTLRSVERHRLEEVAELTNCSLATVKRRIQRAQRFLEEHFVSTEPQHGAATPQPPPTGSGADDD